MKIFFQAILLCLSLPLLAQEEGDRDTVGFIVYEYSNITGVLAKNPVWRINADSVADTRNRVKNVEVGLVQVSNQVTELEENTGLDDAGQTVMTRLISDYTNTYTLPKTKAAVLTAINEGLTDPEAIYQRAYEPNASSVFSLWSNGDVSVVSDTGNIKIINNSSNAVDIKLFYEG